MSWVVIGINEPLLGIVEEVVDIPREDESTDDLSVFVEVGVDGSHPKVAAWQTPVVQRADSSPEHEAVVSVTVNKLTW